MESQKRQNDLSGYFQDKPFNIMIIQVYAPTSNAEEAELFYEVLQDLLEHCCLVHYNSYKSQ